MNKVLFALLLWIAASSMATAQSSDVLENERIRFQKMIAKDTATLSTMLAADLVYVHSNGLTETKQQHLQSVGSGAITYLEMKHVNPPVLRKFHKACYTYGHVQVRGILNGTAFELVLHYSALYQKIHGRWVLLNWQSTKIK